MAKFAVDIHPSPERLRQFSSGEVTGAEAEAIEQHIETCDACCQALRELPPDALANQLQQAATAMQAETIETPARKETRSLDDLLPPYVSPKSAGESTQLVEESLDFLLPAQQPDELGRLGNYRILRKLGAGGMGIVFLAEDTSLHRKVALKMMRPRMAARPPERERFRREAQAAAKIEHDHIVAIYHVGEENNVPYLTMPLLKGESLADRLQREEKLPLAEVLRIGREMAEGLAAAHACGLIHRDIKPGNVWLEGTKGRVKILDFGLARTADDEQHLTQSGIIVGSPPYMAPEQAQDAKIDHRCDLFSLGCVLYRMCVGEMPFKGSNTISTLVAVAAETPRSLHEINSDIPEGLSKLVSQLLAKAPAGRPPSATAVVETIRAIERDQTVLPKAVDPLPAACPAKQPSEPRVYRWRPWSIAAAVLVGVGIAAAVIHVRTNHGTLIIDSKDDNIVVSVKGASAIIHDKVKDRRFVLTPGDYEIEVREEGEGGVRFKTRRFTITRGGTETFQVRFEPVQEKEKQAKSPVQAVAPDEVRKAVERILELGGKVTINVAGVERKLGAIKEWPAGAFRVVRVEFCALKLGNDGLIWLRPLIELTHLDLTKTYLNDHELAHLKPLVNLKELELTNCGRITEAGLVHLQPLTKLESLKLCAIPVQGSGLAHLKSLTSLNSLLLDRIDVHDADLVHLQSLPKLDSLTVQDAMNITDTGLAHLGRLPQLEHLSLARTKISDVGLADLKPLGNLKVLELSFTGISDAGMAHLEGMVKLEYLYLTATKISSVGLKHLAGMNHLKYLYLWDTNVDDAGLDQLKKHTALRVLDLRATKVTADGVAALKKSLPKCNIESDIQLAVPKDVRKAVERVLALGGKVTIKGEGAEREIATLKELSADDFRVVGVSFRNKKLGNDGLIWLRPLRDVNHLVLGGTDVRDQDLIHLSPLTNLKELLLEGCVQLTNAALVHLQPLANLESLKLRSVPVQGSGLAHLKSLTNLKSLVLDRSRVNDADLVHLQALPKLTGLTLEQSPYVTDAGMVHLGQLHHLEHLCLYRVNLTDVGLADLKPLRNLKVLAVSEARISDAGMAHLEGMVKLEYLYLTSTKISSAGLKHLAGMNHLKYLSLWDISVDDAGLDHLKKLASLRKLDLRATRVTAAGVEMLTKALPKCNIESDFSEKPTPSDER